MRILKEGRQRGLLYHFTTPSNLQKILQSNELKSSFMYEDESGKELWGISTTRNKKLFYDNRKIRITLDGDKISQNYKILPRDYWERKYNIPGEPQTIDEDEEVIITHPNGVIENIKKYIIAIDDFTKLNENINNKKKQYFLRWTSNPIGDAERGWSGYVNAWYHSEEEAWEAYQKRIDDGNILPSEPKEDPVSGYWNSEPENGLSGYGFKDQASFQGAMEEIRKIAWYHQEDNNQDLWLFKGTKLPEQGADGEELFSNVEPIKELSLDSTYQDAIRTMKEVRAVIRGILQERFGFNNNHSYSPPENVKAAARQALASGAKTSNGGNEGSGTRKAQELANGTMQSHSQMKRLKAFFDANQPGSPEWELHGGNAAKMWVEKALSGTHDANMRTKENMRRVGGGGHGMNDGMGTMSATMMKTNNSRNHSVWTRTKNRMQEAVKPNRSREILFRDEYGKNIVYDDGSHRIAVDDPEDAAYVTLWREEKGKWIKVGALDAWKSEMNYKDRNGKYLNIVQANIDKKSKGNGYGSKMYQALIDFSASHIAGIYSYLPNRVNKKEIPKIYKKFDSEIDGEYDIIDFQNEAFIDQDGQLKDFSFNDDDAEDEVVDEETGEQFEMEFNMWLYGLNGAKVYGFTFDIDEIGSRWIGDNDDYEIYVHVFPPPDYENIILIHLYKEDNLHYSKSYPIGKDLIYDNGPDRIWEEYLKSLKSFIEECHKTGKFLDI